MTNNYSAFFYGSLMSKNVLLRVLCGIESTEEQKTLKYSSIQSRPVVLLGYKRSCLEGEDYPGMIYTGNSNDSISGIVCHGLKATDIKALDTFEGDDYKRIPIKVTTLEGVNIDTEGYLYIGNPSLITGHEWDLAYFLSSGKEQSWLNSRCEFYDVDKLHVTVKE